MQRNNKYAGYAAIILLIIIMILIGVMIRALNEKASFYNTFKFNTPSGYSHNKEFTLENYPNHISYVYSDDKITVDSLMEIIPSSLIAGNSYIIVDKSTSATDKPMIEYYAEDKQLMRENPNYIAATTFYIDNRLVVYSCYSLDVNSVDSIYVANIKFKENDILYSVGFVGNINQLAEYNKMILTIKFKNKPKIKIYKETLFK